MHDLKWWLGVMAGLVSLGGYIPLILAWKKGWLPHRATWTIWILVTGVIASSMIAKGAYGPALIPIVYCIGTTTISILSFKRGVGGFDTADKLCTFIAILGMILWALTGDPVKALVLNVIADGCAGYPTLIKLLKDPKSEDTLGWAVFCFGGILGVLAARNFTVESVGYPVFVSIFTALICYLTLLPKPILNNGSKMNPNSKN